MKTILSFILTLGLLAAAATADPPDDKGESAYDRAFAALQDLRRENDELRGRLAAAEPGQVEAVRLRAGEALHVDVPTDLLGDDAHLREFAWDFGDAGSPYNALRGFNAAHLYDRPGAFDVTLNGRPFRRVIVVADERPIRVARDAAELAALLRQGGRVRLAAGTIALDRTVEIAPGAVLEGDAKGSTLRWTGQKHGVMLSLPRGGASVRGVTFDSVFPESAGRDAPTAVRPAGKNVAVVGCTFLNVDTGLNGNARPDGVLVQDCAAPLPGGLRGYLAWCEGRRWTFLGNVVANSTREHALRLSASESRAPSCRLVLLAGNDLSNLDRRDEGDEFDTAKSALNVQAAEYVWAEGNTLTATAEAGPLGEGDGLNDPRRRTRFVAWRNNVHRGPVRLKHGLENFLMADSLVLLDAESSANGGAAITVEGRGHDPKYDRDTGPITLRGNAVSVPHLGGRVLWVRGDVRGPMLIEANAFVTGADKSAGEAKHKSPPLVFESGLDAARCVSRDNALPTSLDSGWPEASAVARAGGQNDESAYLTLAEWSALPGVSGDRRAASGVPAAGQVLGRAEISGRKDFK